MNEPMLYAKYNDKQKSDNLYVMENYLKLIKWEKEKAKILDVGCGDGYTTVELLLPRIAENCEKIVGCDLSEKMVKFAETNYEKCPQADFVQMDIAADMLCEKFEERFSHVFSFYCLHWVQNQRQAFKNIYKLLKPGGDMLLTFLASHPIFDIYENMSKKIQWAEYFSKELVSPYHNCRKPRDILENTLKETGFVIRICKMENRKYVYPNLDVLKKSIIAVNPKLTQLSQSDQADYLDDYFHEIKKQKTVKFVPYDNNNEESVHVEYKIFIVYACKPVIE